MTRLEKELCRILDTGTDIHLAKQEAINKEKLIGTYMLINGDLRQILGMYPDVNTIATDIGNVECESLEVFLPETGTYVLDDRCLAILKTPIKSWNKSFKVGGQWLVFAVAGMPKLLVNKLHLAKRFKFLINKKGGVFYFHTYVGQYNKEDNSITCEDYDFYQDLFDFSRKVGIAWKEK